jgi:hypothetical protein
MACGPISKDEQARETRGTYKDYTRQAGLQLVEVEAVVAAHNLLLHRNSALETL